MLARRRAACATLGRRRSVALRFVRMRLRGYILPDSKESGRLDMNKLSARNQIKGKVVEVSKGATTSHVRIDIGGGIVITASITNEAVADLGLKPGVDAWAVIKASDVMVGV
jgi:molybdopterin-binding protein